ncbi:MAG: xanthine dehydrogenase family protein subunit M [Rhodospirillales bacterium]|nr:xanthine dehydrogenase family protein subunit M [Rhodospirillales bacterium]MCY4096656.1 xanthine dehydrogenase family protein subunit M [Rhodospirillales bacterium]MXX22680.1 xanthine dehydrogenase family protein subunit M [Rhodospirillales bacterium]MYE18419.1 xanthine dehydrogenase family protein subunit M [Rhodospirillales bacterium]
MRYEAPETIEGAVKLLAGGGPRGRVLAGGTDLLVQLRAGMIAPELVVDIKRIDETREIREEGGRLVIGAAVTGAELGEHAAAKAMWPGVVEATELIGSTQIQGRASLAGNLCNASPAADTVPALVAAAATCRIAGPGGERRVPVEEVCTGPGELSLDDGEFVVAFEFPERPPRSADAYLRFIPRTEMDIAVVGAGVNLSFDDNGRCAAARVSLGAVAPTVILVEEAGRALVGTECDDAALQNMAAAASAACRPIDDKRGTVEYRTKVAGVLATRAAKIAAQRAKGAR